MLQREPLITKKLGLQPYTKIWKVMQQFTQVRTPDTSDEIWILQHFPVFTQGVAGQSKYVRDTQGIPLVQTDRGGQITYHAPGQIIIYLLLDLHRLNIGIKRLVSTLEACVIKTLSNFSIDSATQKGAPGVYVNHAKIASIGLRVRKGYTYHGLALNFQMDLNPFLSIDPCGYKGMKITQLCDLIQGDLPLQEEVEDIMLFFLKEALLEKKL